MPYKNVAIIGAGVIGTPIVKALLQEGANVVVVSRPASTSGKDLPAGAKVVAIEYTDIFALAALFKEHATEVVISTVNSQALRLQHGMGDAAKQAGVKLFVPSEFGVDTAEYNAATQNVKTELAAHLKNIGLPSARIFNGLFTTFLPWLLSVDTGKIRLVGKGDQKYSVTHPDDIAGFLAYILTHLPESELHDKVFRLEGERTTMNDVIRHYGGKYPVEHVDTISGEAGKTFLQTIIEHGQALAAAEGEATSNALWTGHAWKGVTEVLGL